MKTARDAAALSIQNLRIEARQGTRRVALVDDVSFDLPRGEVVGLVGESGSGKTMTSRALIGLLPENCHVASGNIFYEGRDMCSADRRELEDIRGAQIGTVFQESMTSLNPALTVGHQIAETIQRHEHITGREAKKRALETMDLVGLPGGAGRYYAYPHEYSGGMRQRICIAIAISCKPKILIADEPTTALDVTIQSQILRLILDLKETIGLSVLLITHDLGVVANTCDRVLVMYAGQIVEKGNVVPFFEEPLHPYSVGLLRSAYRLSGQGQERFTIPGRPPLPSEVIRGCRFQARCDWAEEDCRQGDIQLLERSGGRESRCIHKNALELDQEMKQSLGSGGSSQ